MAKASTEIVVAAYRFWCGELAGTDDFPAEKAKLWFERRDETDEAIRSAFGSHLDAVAARDWNLAALSPEAQVGLVIFLDQFPRNLFRADARAFAYDARAREIARALVRRGISRYRLIERAFLYLPFEHSEDLADQELSVSLFEQLLIDAPAEQAETYRNYLVFAEKHRDLIRRFGRFPHRNSDLGRDSTPEEAAFLAEHGRGY